MADTGASDGLSDRAPNGAIIPYDKDLPEVPGRQGVSHLPPDAYLRKKEGAAEAFEVVAGRRPNKLLLVNRLREAVGEWREGGYAGASSVTLRLFSYWFEDDHEVASKTFRYYFGQREAVETLAYLVEVRGLRDAGELVGAFGEVFRDEGASATLGLDEIAVEQNAATGRRWVRRYDPERGGEVRQDLPPDGLPRYAIKAATGSGKTVVMALVVAWSYLHARLVEDSPLPRNFLVVAPNVIVYQRLEKDFAAGAVFRELPVIPPEWRNLWTLKTILRGEGTEPDASGNLFLTNIQQLYGPEADQEMTPENAVEALLGVKPTASALSGERPMLERLKGLPNLAVLNDEAHHVHDEDLKWTQSLMEMHATVPGGLGLWLDFSATPKDQGGAYFPWCVSDYPLAQAVEDRIVKSPLIVHRVEKEGPRASVSGAQEAVEAYADWVRASVARYREHEGIYRPLGLKPVLFVMAEKSAHADAIGKWLWQEKEFGFTEDEVLVIHTRASGEILQGDLEKARVAARQIDEPGNRIKAVVSVLMLREGWDVRNVTVVLGLRPFNAISNILPEQAVGRGLRLMGGVSPDRTQTLEVLGTPGFETFVRGLESEGVGIKTVTDPPKDPVVIEPVRSKLDLDIEVPLSRPRLSRSYRDLSGLDPLSVEPLFELDALGGRGRVRLRMEFVTTETDVHEAELDLGKAPPSYELLSRLVGRVAHHARLSGDFSTLYPFVRRYVKERAFGGSVDPDERRVRAALRLTEMREPLARHLAGAVGRATVREEELSLQPRVLKLSETKPFTWRRNLPPASSAKTIFNYVATYNSYEKAFAEALGSWPDVARFAALGTTEQGSAAVFKVDYLKPSGAIGFYHPDWVVVQRTAPEDGSPPETNWIVETKGRVWEDTGAKDVAMTRWCEAVSAQTGERWRFVRIDQRDFERGPWTSFGDLANSSGGVGEGRPSRGAELFPQVSSEDTDNTDGGLEDAKDPAIGSAIEMPPPYGAPPAIRGAGFSGEPTPPDELPPTTESLPREASPHAVTGPAEDVAGPPGPPEAIELLHACIPDGERVAREDLLERAAWRLGHRQVSRGVRRALNKAIAAEHKARRLRVDPGWTQVWRPKKG